MKTPLRLRSSLDTQILEVRKIVVHEKFTLASMHYDIALLKLRQSISLNNKWAAAITLPQTRINDSSLCTVLGWGRLYLVSRQFYKSDYHSRLLYAVFLEWPLGQSGFISQCNVAQQKPL